LNSEHRIFWLLFNCHINFYQLFIFRPNNKEEPGEQEVNRTPADNDELRRPQIPQQNYPDAQQIFVGNLPQYLSDKDLREFFSRMFQLNIICFGSFCVLSVVIVLNVA